MKKLLLILMMVIMGAVLSLAFPRASLWPIAWVGLVPLLMLLRDSRPMTAALATFAFGMGFFGTMLHWVSLLGPSLWVLLALKETLQLTLFGVFASIAYRSRYHWLVLLAIPALWTATEWLRSLGTLGFLWGYLAHSQVQNLPGIQVVSLTGTWGLTFVIVLVNTALASPKGKVLKSVVIAALVAVAVHTWGYWSMNRESPQRDKLAVTIAQGSVDMDPNLTPKQLGEYTVSVYSRLSYEAFQYRPDLIVWPESAVPGDIVKNPEAHKWIASIARGSGAHMLVGGPFYVPLEKSRLITKKNGAHMLSPDGTILGSYYKVRLAPFGEFVPWRKYLPFLQYYSIRNVDLIPGTEHNLLPTPFGKTGVMICFETAFPAIARQETIDGADFLCALTRSVIFKKSAEALQHHDLAVFRAVENRRFVVHSAETGISSIIDPYGRVIDRLGMWKRGVLYGEVETRDDLTIYTRFGDWFLYLCLVISAFSVGSGIAAQRRKRAIDQ